MIGSHDRFRCSVEANRPRSLLSSPVQERKRKEWRKTAVLWNNGFGFGACTSIDPKRCRSIRGWPSGPRKKIWSTKRSKSHPLVPTSAFVSIMDIRSARFSTAPDPLRGGMKFTVYAEILSSERNKEELSGFDSIEFVGISLEKYQDRCGIISGIIFAGR